MKPGFLIAALVATGIIRPTSAQAVTPAPVFADGAVLQQGMPVPVWGMAKANEKVTVRFAGQEQSTQAGEDGKWMVRLSPLQASSEGRALTISGDDTVEIRNVVVGEVWLCSGQSNMAWTLKQATGGNEAAQVADPLLRAIFPRTMARPVAGKSPWLAATPETSPGFSAVAFFFGRALRRDLRVPVALLTSAVGGTPAERWMPREAIESSGAARVVFGRAVDIGTPAQLSASAGSLYRSMIVPFQPYAMRGVIWYQGETNQMVGYDYRKTFPALIKSWRDAWQQGDFPFLFVQLAAFESERNPYFVEVRDSQLETLKAVPKTAMVVSIDKSTPNDVHPPDKEPIGERLELAARAVAFGEKLIYSGPLFKAAKVENAAITLSFDSIGQGLEARGGELRGFTIAGEDGEFVPATTKIVGDTIVVSSEQVARPKWVRYSWANVPDGNLFNRDGLPASPFRTDSLALKTQLVP